MIPAGVYIPLAAMDFDRHKLERFQAQLQQQADVYGKVIRLAKFTFVEDVIELQPRSTKHDQ